MPSNISDKTLTLIACFQALGLVLMDVGFVNISFGAWNFFFDEDIAGFQSFVAAVRAHSGPFLLGFKLFRQLVLGVSLGV